MRKFLICLILIGVFGFIGYDSVIAVPDGYAGVATYRVSRLGPISTAPRTLRAGLHLSLPLVTRLTLYNLRVQILVLQVPLGEGKIFQMTAQVRLDPDSAVLVHQKRGPQYIKEQIQPWLTELMKNKIYENRGRLSTVERQDDLLSAIRQDLALDGLVLERAFLTRLEHLELKEEPAAEQGSDTDEE